MMHLMVEPDKIVFKLHQDLAGLQLLFTDRFQG